MKIIQASKLSKKGQERSSGNSSETSSTINQEHPTREKKSAEIDIFDGDDSWENQHTSRDVFSSNEKAKKKGAWKSAKSKNRRAAKTLGSAVRKQPTEQECEYEEEAPLAPGKKRRRSETTTPKAHPISELVSDPAKKEFNEIFARGIRLLAMREHSVKEMIDKLSAKTEFMDQVHAVIDELLENKYLSDDRFAESYVRSRANRGFGPVKIRAELKAKGVASNLIQDHLNPNASIWFDNAEAQYQKKYADSPLSDYNAWTKRARFMQSRGFTMEQIQVTIPQFSSE